MDVTILGTESIRVKGRSATAIINPTSSIGKTEADSVIYLENNPNFSDSKLEGTRIKIIGPGEYEIGGIKFTMLRVENKLAAKIDVDSVSLLIGSGTVIEKIQDKVENCDLLVINADKEFNYSVLASIEPKVLLVYGPKKTEVSKSIGKADGINTNKFTTTADKLPSEMQFVLLG